MKWDSVVVPGILCTTRTLFGAPGVAVGTSSVRGHGAAVAAEAIVAI